VVNCVVPLNKTSLYAGKSGVFLDTSNSNNSKMQTISRQPALAESPQRLHAKNLII